MARNIKGITIEINGDTTGLDKALSSVNNNANKTQSELRDVNKLLKLDPGNTELIAQKQKLLAQAISQTGDKLKTLKDAQAQVDAQFAKGDIGEEQYRAFQREIAATESTLRGYKSQLTTAQSSQQELGQSTQRLNTFFKATGTEIDDFKSVIGTRLVSAIKSGTASSEAMDKALQMIAKEAGIASTDMSQLTSSLDKVNGGNASMSSLKSSISGLSSEAKSADGVFGSFKQKLSLGAVAGAGANAISSITGGLSSLVSEGVSASDAIDKFNSTMKFAGFGKDQINTAKEAVQDYANKTVYSLSDVSNTTAQLAANGVKDYTGLTEAAGNLNAVAGGNADTFSSVAMVLTQTAGAGKLTTENWNQLADAIPGASGKLQEAMKNNGAFTGNFRDAMEKGQISADEFNTALKQLGMTDTAKKAATATNTFEGAIGNLQANVVTGIQNVINSIGKANFTEMINTISNGVVSAFKVLISALQAIVKYKDFFMPLTAAVTAFFVAFKAAQAINAVVTTFKTLKTAITGSKIAMVLLNSTFLANPIVAIIAVVVALAAALVVFFTKTTAGKQIWQSFMNWLKSTWKGISSFFSELWTGIKKTFNGAVQGIVSSVTSKFNQLKRTTSNIWNSVKSVTSSVWNGIKSVISSVANGIKNTVSSVWNGIRSVTLSVFTGVRSIASSVWNRIRLAISLVVNSIRSTVSNVWNGIRSVTSSVWNGIKSAITSPIETARNAVSRIINAIKSMFNFKLKFPSVDIPHIPLPHFSLSGSFNPLKGKIPSVGIDWYAKGGVFTKPTLFANNGGFSGVGEAGPEAALPLNAKTLGGIGKGIAEATGGLGGDTINVTVQVLADTSARTIKKLTDAVTDGITRAQNAKTRAIGG
ncbi:phage tail tape measure protein [Weissella soli]|uniref:tape measure protein n=1 Tax=Weissella soli TaxID=155866 RepID=UPI0021C13DEF|nr:tape measure protein [Weissella soli]MCT8395231.1 phage tail tape measure protein [Weissella soli]